ncbi:MAG: nuclear transport factor 2 family protein [Clostridia bacterium]|nr:nuclear transport factor 2 family protein [Clostridia bacterium]
MDLHAFWQDVVTQNRDRLASYFCGDAVIRWPCTNEQFTLAEYLRVNCDYPGSWDGEIERMERLADVVVVAGRVFSKEGAASFHVVSFIRLVNDRIGAMDEYWAEDGEAPEWRRGMNIGKRIRP